MLAEAQGGTLTHSPRVDGGSVFTFTLRALDPVLDAAFDDPDATPG